jgi:hypothetical protein
MPWSSSHTHSNTTFHEFYTIIFSGGDNIFCLLDQVAEYFTKLFKAAIVDWQAISSPVFPETSNPLANVRNLT